ncbi:AKAP7 2'5' RNA ligase-like domain-containing protein [Podospora didyma]|uniref:AKAP7 2'5' RNA ligase-like domain-containing protein n=1 Tax=Podospora didyma TaxID=330526 RepID=A0AAE0NT97_9PEZI|nr:AKAP7 2'5' RNA ligase-like domain-containing protein [Podospora didyma]
MPPRSAPTHFLCIPLTTQASRPQLLQSLGSFRADVSSPQSFGVPEEAIRPVGTLHLTLGVFSFPKNEGLDQAIELLRLLRPRELLTSIAFPAIPGVEGEVTTQALVKEEKDSAATISELAPLTITLRGLETMQKPDKASVLYALPVDQMGRLQAFCEKLRTTFQEAKLMMEDNRPLLLHATIANTIYVKGGRDKKSKKPGGKRWDKLTIDARGILDRYEDQIWMEDVGNRRLISKLPPFKLLGDGFRQPQTGFENLSATPERKAENLCGLLKSWRERQTEDGNELDLPSTNENKIMTTSEKRRAPPGGPGSPSRAIRGSDSSSSSTNARGGASVIAAPPRAALGAAAEALKEKDARIESLERELGIMESEFHRELDKLSTTESETASYWQAKCAGLSQQLQQADTELRMLRSESEQRGFEREDLRAACDRLKRDREERDREIRDLRAQIHGLKEWVSTSTRADGQAQTSDEVFGDSMARLGNGLQNWVLVNFRRAKIDLCKASESTITELSRLVPMYEELASIAKVHLLQSIISQLLVELVFDAYFIGLSSDQAEQVTQVECFLASFASSPEPINQWRSLTLTILKKAAGEKMQTETANITEGVVSIVNHLLESITDSKATDTRDQGLRALITSAIELSRLLVVQKAVLKVTMPQILPHQKIMFDASTMEDIGGEDEESLSEREICCAIFPGIIKRGDESGGPCNAMSKYGPDFPHPFIGRSPATSLLFPLWDTEVGATQPHQQIPARDLLAILQRAESQIEYSTSWLSNQYAGDKGHQGVIPNIIVTKEMDVEVLNVR